MTMNMTHTTHKHTHTHIHRYIYIKAMVVSSFIYMNAHMESRIMTAGIRWK